MKTMLSLLIVCNAAMAQVQLMPRERLDAYLRLLPEVDDPQLRETLRSADTIWYDESVMPPAYQIFDTAAAVNNTSIAGVHDPAYDISGGVDALDKGNANREFPWLHPAGTHLCPEGTLLAVKFFRLPRVSGRLQPVGLYRLSSQRHLRWIFPVGTVFGEVLMISDPSGGWLPFELRTREREPDDWMTKVFRPLPTKYDTMLAAVSAGADADTVRAIGDAAGTLATLTSGAANDAFHRDFRMTHLPEMDPAVVRKLLRRPFADATGVPWSSDSDGPTSRQAFSVVPQNYLGAVTGDASRENCRSCHDSVGRKAEDFNFDREWYGRVRGSDGIFSWHPFSRESISKNGRGLPIKYRAEFLRAGLIKAWQPRQDDSRIYRLSKFEKDRT